MFKCYPNTLLVCNGGLAFPHTRRKIANNGDRCLRDDDHRHPLHGQRHAKHRLTYRNTFLDSTEAHNTSKQDVRTTLWVDEWNAHGERSTEWRDRGIYRKQFLLNKYESNCQIINCYICNWCGIFHLHTDLYIHAQTLWFIVFICFD